MKRFSISLQNRLTLTYALFICLTLGVLILVINHFTSSIFNKLVKENIESRRQEIARVMAEQYQSGRRHFNIPAIEAMGRYFVEEGFIVSLEDERGNPVWDARSFESRRSQIAMRRIANRMEGRVQGSGKMQRDRIPLDIGNRRVGTVHIETYGPLFYSETETAFLQSLNRLLFMAGFALIMLSIVISVLLSRTIARPIFTAGEAARRIAESRKALANVYALGEPPVIRINDNYRTRELAELSRSINTLAEELEEGERRQKQLSRDIAHELRTPLASLQGTLEAMIDGVYSSDRERLESCHEEILRLSRLVDDLAILTGFEWNKISLHKTDFDLALLLEQTVEQWRPAAAEKGIVITTELSEVHLAADWDRLKQVFVNLLSNAVKYTDQGSITVALRRGYGEGRGTDEGRSACTVVTVTDTGIGIPEEELAHIFERFYRSDKSRSRSTGGAGIGLSIAAAIIAAHGGTISAESSPAGGTLFRIEL